MRYWVAVYAATVKYLICLNSVGKGGGVEGLNRERDALRQTETAQNHDSDEWWRRLKILIFSGNKA